jgi:hypothetical protein
MEANELRIGNLLYNNNVVVTIDARSIFDIWDDKGLKEYKPIPLTPEWLNKFELEHSEIRGRWFKDKFVVFKQKYLDPLSILEENKFYFQMVDCQGNVSTSTFEIKYVHQLQNLYFALTGEELKQQEQ